MKQWGFAAAGGDFFRRLDIGGSDQEGVVEIIYGGADMAGEQIQGFADSRRWWSWFYGHGEMLFAGGKRSEFGMAQGEAGGDAGVGGNGFVAGVAGDDAGVGVAYHAGQYECRGAVAVLERELMQAGGVAINDGSRRDAVNEVPVAKTFIAERAGECGRACGDDFRDADTGTVEVACDFQ